MLHVYSDVNKGLVDGRFIISEVRHRLSHTNSLIQNENQIFGKVCHKNDVHQLWDWNSDVWVVYLYNTVFVDVKRGVIIIRRNKSSYGIAGWNCSAGNSGDGVRKETVAVSGSFGKQDSDSFWIIWSIHALFLLWFILVHSHIILCYFDEQGHVGK